MPLGSKKREILSVLLPFVSQYSSHLYRSTPPICIAIRLPLASQCFWENLGGCGHRDVPQLPQKGACLSVRSLPKYPNWLQTDTFSGGGELISNYRYRIELPEELISGNYITETDLWTFQQKISHYRYRFSLEILLISFKGTGHPKMTFLLWDPNDYTHIFMSWELMSQLHRTSVTGRNSFVWFGHLHKVLFVDAPIAHKNSLGIAFPIACTSVTQKIFCFRIICIIISGLITFVQ